MEVFLFVGFLYIFHISSNCYASIATPHLCRAYARHTHPTFLKVRSHRGAQIIDFPT